MGEKLIHNFDTMRDLIAKLNYHTTLYDSGKPSITDKEWDDMYFQLQELEKEFGVVLANSPTAHIDYQVVNKLNKVTHNHPMLSLDKTKDIDELVKFCNNIDCIAMAKMDGLTCSIKYQNGKLVSAETRGNGTIGEDITHNIIFVKGVPVEIPIEEEFIVDGEIICTYADFEPFKDEYANPRNFASGSIRLLDARASAARNLTFVAWDCIKGFDNLSTLSEKLFKLNDLGFLFTPYIVLSAFTDNITKEKINHAIYLIKDTAKEFAYPIDGIVFKYDNCKYYNSLGATEHHFKGGIAFKFYDEEYETHLRNIEWSMGKTGVLTPVAVFDPVNDGESIITRASLHNLNIMKQLLDDPPYVGQTVWVCKQNQIIPQIVKAEKFWPEIPILIPKKCPICGENTFIKDDFLYCSNPDCDGKFINHLDHFVGKKGLDIKGLSKATLQKLINWEWVTSLKDIFHLYSYQNEWAKKDGFGSKSVMNILTAIEDSKDCELWQFISALSIPLIGSTYAKEIAKKCATWDDFRNTTDFLMWDGFGPEMSSSLLDFDYEEADELVKEEIIHLKNSLQNQQTVESNINGKIICITGSLNHFKNRGELKSFIEEHGGKVTDSVSKKTNYLINNDINSSSSKNKKAHELNIPILTEDDLLKII